MKRFGNNTQLGIGALVAFVFLLLGLILEVATRWAPVLLLVAVAGVLVGCGGDNRSLDNETPAQAAARKACYADAQAQLSPQWAGATRLDRAVVAMKVISTCEGQ